jgi:hypothetical protein
LLGENQSMLHMLGALGDVEQRRGESGTVEVRLHVPAEPHEDEHEGRLADWIRARATGELEAWLRHGR